MREQLFNETYVHVLSFIYETLPDKNCVEQCFDLILVKRVLLIRLLLKNICLITQF